jgi:NAD(P)-dependent dehydrogenase (short-subunit alcohol dehydrogenase family)
MDIRLDGRTALITGGSLGLGRAMAHRFAEAGAKVAIVARRQDVLDEAKTEIAAATGGAVGAYACDVRDAADIKAMYARAIAELGPVDILVNNAGTSNAKSFLEVSDEEWQEDLDLKLFGAIRLTRLAMPGMIDRKWGRIINVVSIQAKAQGPSSTPTSVSRAAGMALTKALAGEGGPHGVLANAMLVGWYKTDQFIRRHQRVAPEKTFEEYMQPWIARIPVRRVGDPDEFATMACFLASDAASYVNGTAINMDGGASPVV